MNRSLYPSNWNEIAREVKEKAGWKCEECGVPHDSYIVRDRRHPEKWRFAEGVCEIDEPKGTRVVHVVLTVHHKGVPKLDGSPGDSNDKMDNRPENLACLCQRCHLLADLEHHQAKAKKTRMRKRRARQLSAGQKEMF